MWFRKRPSPYKFDPVGGTLDAQLFENPKRGVTRTLFWNLTLDFKEYELEGDTETHNCLAERFTIPQHETVLKFPLTLSNDTHTAAEVSCYIETLHIEAQKWSFDLIPATQPDTWDLRYALSLKTRLLELATTRTIEVKGETQIRFDGIILVKCNLAPELVTPEDAKTAIAPFFDVSHLTCQDEGFRFVFRRPNTP